MTFLLTCRSPRLLHAMAEHDKMCEELVERCKHEVSWLHGNTVHSAWDLPVMY